jgi:hypothetical protein
MVTNKKTMERITTLRQRRERLIELNNTHKYTQMLYTRDGEQENPKTKQYLDCLRQIAIEMYNHYNEKRIWNI